MQSMERFATNPFIIKVSKEIETEGLKHFGN